MSDVARVRIFRSITEALLGPLVFTRRLPADCGRRRIVVSGKVGGLKYLFKRAVDWDPELLRIASMLVNKDDTVWDIGANVGLFSKSAAYRSGEGGHVYAVEADTDAQVLLQRSFLPGHPKDAPITLLPVAISSKVGWENFAISRRARASNSLAGYGSSSTGGVLQNRIVPSFTLDSMLEKFPPPDVLKVDVEGAEVEVFEGGKEMLHSVRPLIYCEISAGNARELETIFRKSSYRFMAGEKLMTLQDLARVNNGIGFNTVAAPEEFADRMAKA